MHGGYARPPCGVTLTGSVRAHVPHAPFIPGAQSLRELAVRRVQCRVILPQPSHGGAAAAKVRKNIVPG